MKYLSFALCLFLCTCVSAQNTLHGVVLDDQGVGIPYASVLVADSGDGSVAEYDGRFTIPEYPVGTLLRISAVGFAGKEVAVGAINPLEIKLEPTAATLADVVVTGTMRSASRSSSPVPVEVFTAKYFKANPTPSVFESLQTVNGVRPQLNCSVCNTGDIHINGLEGPYTMVLIDGMPIVSGLSTVYGLTGIPQSLIERVEIVKGPASTLYGSEAVGGLINIITKSPENAPRISADIMASGWGEINTDLGYKTKIGNATSLLGVNYFNYQNPIDNNGDDFTDLTLQDRISVFNKWSLDRKSGRALTIAGRYLYEDRFGGQLDWNRGDRGGNEVYGESIYTNRWETFGTYELPTKANLTLQFSANGHYQNSVYGETIYNASQQVGFLQLTHQKEIGTHNLLLGGAYRYTRYNDDTPATREVSEISLPGLFVQDEWRLNEFNTLLGGLRYDHNSVHGSILTPRLNYKWSSQNLLNTVRLSVGNGYRVANVFTEDHAALTGARDLVFADELLPEKSWNVNLNYVRKHFARNGAVWTFDASTWYTHFSNRILPDYETNPNQIIYANLDGRAVSQGVSLTTDVSFRGGASVNVGLNVQDVFTVKEGVRERQLLTETYSGVWRLGIPWLERQITFDYTGNVYGPLDLPLLGEMDDRPADSGWFSTQNLQVTKTFSNGMEVYGGVKNLLNYTPPANSIARAFDPFDEDVDFNPDGTVIPTPTNPNALTFDPTYVFASNQGRRVFLGWRVSL
ncbi:TonB-dependent receptor [Lewinella sp. 4G2]|uniref:TonB-dependent receptor n=1 Tax=Lewinella sp. 4G2 TaxID=1803372 RepID=UPI0007B4860E|nr:TonB-dependent receptor [Lewinella sp. 4G2]OAV45356.1 TonB-dependent receptor [Lewinella sp. 4G2]